MDLFLRFLLITQISIGTPAIAELISVSFLIWFCHIKHPYENKEDGHEPFPI
ncbi:hypothetical protein [Metabacillus sp. RGM 3146]|uniref:hypothetical protein n=1 Tax=Metabacillus sp. RGM 3146 TaxID=3401092 RepID=UPI003B9DAAE8